MAFFPSVAGYRHLAGRVCSGPGLVFGAGLDWTLGSEVIAIRLEMGRRRRVWGLVN